MEIRADKADAKWCPFARVISSTVSLHPVTNHNRDLDGEPDTGCMCLGDRCMAWRPVSKVKGFCGLAGPPVDPPAEGG